jgi:hypothetical protein
VPPNFSLALQLEDQAEECCHIGPSASNRPSGCDAEVGLEPPAHQRHASEETKGSRAARHADQVAEQLASESTIRIADGDGSFKGIEEAGAADG